MVVVPQIGVITGGQYPFVEARPLAPNTSAWELVFARRSADARGQKRQFLQALRDKWPDLILQSPEDPVADEVPGTWAPFAPGFYGMPADAPTDELLRWLNYGNWMIYRTIEGDTRKPWSFQSLRKPQEVVKDMGASGIHFCLYAFHDNEPWFLFVNPKAPGLRQPTF